MDRFCYLVLADGSVFRGKRFGAYKNTTGEVVFTTSETGYLDTLGDRAYAGQMIVHSFPLIGNYGVIPEELGCKSVECHALIVREYSENPSNFRCEGKIDDLLKELDVPGLYGIDTRALVRRLREHGIMNGCLCDDPGDVDMQALKAYKIPNSVAKLSCKTPYAVKSSEGKYKVAVMDYGISDSLVQTLVSSGCDVTVFPYNADCGAISAFKPDGIIFSNGAGDPRENAAEVEQAKLILKTGIPSLGIGFGHLIMAQSAGIDVVKLKYGHRGSNQPVRDLSDGRVYITGQNHGFAVSTESVAPGIADTAFVNCNDRTCEGLTYCDIPAFSVQFDPASPAGPQDTAFLINRFFGMMNAAKEA